MFIGHYAIGFAIKRKAPDIPLWALFIGVQLVDIIWAILMLLGVERASFDAAVASVYLRPIYEFYPYTHSLFMSIIIAGLVYLVVRKLRGKNWAMWLSLAVLSHWFLDIIVHVADMPLFFNKFKIGLGLWQYPYAALRTEIILLGLGAILYLWGKKFLGREHIRTIIFLIPVFGIAIVGFFAPATEPTVLQISLTSIAMYLLIALGGWWVEREKSIKRIEPKRNSP